MMRFVRVLLLTVVLLPLAAPLHAQAPPAVVDVFLDCNAHGCDTQHFRNEITWVNWVRDRTVADVHVLITSQGSGGGGSVYQLSFIGLRRFAADSATLSLTVSQNSTESERRDLLTNRLAQGLIAYAAGSGAADRLRVVYDAADDDDAAQEAAGAQADPWNFWVFNVGLDASKNGQKTQGSTNFNLNGRASRVTEAWKFETELEGSYEEDRFELKTGERTFVTRNWQVDGILTRALADHWSAGFAFETGTSTFDNQDFYARPATVLEYSYFPYSEYTRRRVLVQYMLGARHFEYEEPTIYGEVRELRYDQRLQLQTQFRQPWGSAGLTLNGSHYLHNIKRYSMSVRGDINVRLFRGFSLNVNGNYSRVNDQLYIAAGDLDDEEILLRRQALATNYRYGTSIGINYTFGSVYNNVVNPRVGGPNSF